MKAVIVADKNKLTLQDVAKPTNVSHGHLLIKMLACGINSGDKLFIAGAFPRGIPASRYAIAGVSDVGTVVETGKGVPDNYKGENVAVYRSLRSSEDTIGTWSEYVHLHYLNCAVIPDSLAMEEYAGSLVNTITAYAFLKHAMSEGHRGYPLYSRKFCNRKSHVGFLPYPSISDCIDSKKRKRQKGTAIAGCGNIVVQSGVDFKKRLGEISEQLNTTAIFDGVGGRLLTDIIDEVPFNSSIYSYGFLDGETAFSFSTKVLMRGINIQGCSNFRTQTVQDEKKLAAALDGISKIIHMPHFTTKTGKQFSFGEANEALAFSSAEGKAVLVI